jgi:hypothetical protein
MIEFTTVSNEFQSLVARRGHLVTFLGSLFAAMGILLRNITGGSLPPALAGLEAHAFALFAVLLLVPSLIIALRMAKLAAGMTIQGILYARLSHEQPFATKRDPQRAARLNVLGVSFLSFLIADLIAGFSAALLALALEHPPLAAALLGAGFVIVWLLLYLRNHRRAARFALDKIATEPCGPYDRDDWLEHVTGSMEEANKGMITDIGFVGLMMFSGIEGMTGLGNIKQAGLDLIAQDVQQLGPTVYAGMMVVVGFFGLLINLRVRLAIGGFSLALDPTDRPFRPLRLTDSLLGYLLLAFLFTVAVHLLLYPYLSAQPFALVGIDLAVLAVSVLIEQLTLVYAARRVKAF